jgi:hypothetical protein
MFDQSNFYPNSGSYDDLLKRMTRRVQQNKVDDQILEILQQVFEKEFNKESVMLSRHERVRLFQQVTKAILTDVLGKIGDTE